MWGPVGLSVFFFSFFCGLNHLVLLLPLLESNLKKIVWFFWNANYAFLNFHLSFLIRPNFLSYNLHNIYKDNRSNITLSSIIMRPYKILCIHILQYLIKSKSISNIGIQKYKSIFETLTRLLQNSSKALGTSSPTKLEILKTELSKKIKNKNSSHISCPC